MDLIRSASPWLLLLWWVAFSGLLAWNHAKVRGERKSLGIPEERPAIRDSRSMHGLVLEGLSFVIAFAGMRSAQEASDWQHVASIVSGFLSVAVLLAALRHLGLEWRIKAVVTEDHRLVTTGPYGVIRHPVFAALFCLLLATVFLITKPWAGILAVCVCLWGTEIRVRAEEGLLFERFGKRFTEYRMRTTAYVPFIR